MSYTSNYCDRFTYFLCNIVDVKFSIQVAVQQNSNGFTMSLKSLRGKAKICRLAGQKRCRGIFTNLKTILNIGGCLSKLSRVLLEFTRQLNQFVSFLIIFRIIISEFFFSAFIVKCVIYVTILINLLIIEVMQRNCAVTFPYFIFLRFKYVEFPRKREMLSNPYCFP